MKLLNKLTISALFFIGLGIFLPLDVKAQQQVGVSAVIEVSEELSDSLKNDSWIEVEPKRLEIGEESQVKVYIVDEKFSPLPDVEVNIFAESDDEVEVNQLSEFTNEEGVATGTIVSDVPQVVEVYSQVTVHGEEYEVDDREEIEFYSEGSKEKSTSVFNRVADTISKAVNAIGDFIRQNPGTAATAAVAIPAATTAVSLFSTFGFSLFEAPQYISRGIMWFLNLFGVIDKKEEWGVVYDSVTKQPLPRAVVRLYSGRDLIDTSVTDSNGVFSFAPVKGKYTLSVAKRGYTFPSEIITSKIDGVFGRVYRGDVYEVKKDGQVINVGVPLDSEEVEPLKAFFVRLGHLLVAFVKILNPILLFAGILLSIFLYITYRDDLNLYFAFLYLGLLLLNIYFTLRQQSRWGFVVDTKGDKIPGVRVNLYESKYDKLIDTRVTDENGKYQFVVPGGEYVIRPEGKNYVIDDPKNKEGYEINKMARGDILIAKNLVLRKINQETT